MSKMLNIIDESFTQYAGAVLQSRALVDVRDCIKPSARQIFYSMLENKLISSKPYKSTANAVGRAMADYYIHGDSSCAGVIMRAAQNFAMRYPLVSVSGNSGTLISSGDWSATRYTKSRLSQLSDTLFKDIDKETISEWRDNYSNEKQYPSVLPSKGFYNIVNGTVGIGIGAASSIPQFNLQEVNKALVYLLWNPDCSFEDIYCAPDFATGGLLLNENEIKDSLKKGTGFACKLRAVVDYDTSERCLIVKEMPYGVYTNTVCTEIEEILNGEENPGIDKFNDLTGEQPLIKIYLKKNASPEKVLRYLYKKTSLQSHYGINMTMLLDGRFPKVFGWKEALSEYLKHQIKVYTNAITFDLNKLKARLHIVEGLLIALQNIEEVIATIKQSASTTIAQQQLQEKFNLTSVQAKAILDMKLARLAHLEIEKLLNEKQDLILKIEGLEKILNDEILLKKEIETDLLFIAKKFGDARRTQILNIENEDDEEPREIKNLSISLTNKNNLIANETSSLYIQRRGGVGTKFKLDKDEYIVSSTTAKNNDTILFFTNSIQGCYCYKLAGTEIPIDIKTPLEVLLNLQEHERVIEFTNYNKKQSKQFIIFVTKKGYIKKSELSEYNTKRSGAIKALELYSGDELCAVTFVDNEKIGIVTEKGRFLICRTDDIRPTGRVTKGVHGIKLNDWDGVSCIRIIPKDTKEILSITASGYAKRTDIKEFSTATRNTKGQVIQKIQDEFDYICDLLPIIDEKDILIVSSGAQIKIKIDTIPLLSKNTQGTRCMKLKEQDHVIGISK